MRSARSSWPHSLGPYAALRRGSDFAPLGRCIRESTEIRRSVKWLWVSWRVGTNALMSVIALRLGAEAPRGAARPIREASTQPAQPEVGGCKQRYTSSRRRDRSPVRHLPQGPQIASDARTNDMPSESCRGPCSGVPLRPQAAPFYLFSPSLVPYGGLGARFSGFRPLRTSRMAVSQVLRSWSRTGVSSPALTSRRSGEYIDSSVTIAGRRCRVSPQHLPVEDRTFCTRFEKARRFVSTPPATPCGGREGDPLAYKRTP